MSKLRPIALHDVKRKCLMNILCIQVEQIFQQLTHRREVGCVKGRQMLHHIWSMRSGYEDMSQGILVSFDFSKAFPSFSHSFIEAVLEIICLPASYIQFALPTLAALFHFCVGKGVVREVLFEPQSGIGQGDPFSTVLFSFCVSFVLYPIEEIPRTNPYMYVDDLCVLIRGMRIGQLLQRVYDCMSNFALFSGLHLHLAKCGVVVKGSLHTDAQAHVEAFSHGELLLGILIRQSVKYLGVRIGNISSDGAYAYPLAEVQRRASVVAGLSLSLRECILRLKTWVLPTILLTVRAYHPSMITVRSLKVIYNMTLHLDCSDSLSALSLP